jgi:hypothetical protein
VRRAAAGALAPRQLSKSSCNCQPTRPGPAGLSAPSG